MNLKSSLGFSLSEVMVALGIGSFALVGVNQYMSNYRKVKSENKAEEGDTKVDKQHYSRKFTSIFKDAAVSRKYFVLPINTSTNKECEDEGGCVMNLSQDGERKTLTIGNGNDWLNFFDDQKIQFADKKDTSTRMLKCPSNNKYMVNIQKLAKAKYDKGIRSSKDTRRFIGWNLKETTKDPSAFYFMKRTKNKLYFRVSSEDSKFAHLNSPSSILKKGQFLAELVGQPPEDTSSYEDIPYLVLSAYNPDIYYMAFLETYVSCSKKSVNGQPTKKDDINNDKCKNLYAELNPKINEDTKKEESQNWDDIVKENDLSPDMQKIFKNKYILTLKDPSTHFAKTNKFWNSFPSSNNKGIWKNQRQPNKNFPFFPFKTPNLLFRKDVGDDSTDCDAPDPDFGVIGKDGNDLGSPEHVGDLSGEIINPHSFSITLKHITAGQGDVFVIPIHIHKLYLKEGEKDSKQCACKDDNDCIPTDPTDKDEDKERKITQTTPKHLYMDRFPSSKKTQKLLIRNLSQDSRVVIARQISTPIFSTLILGDDDGC